MGDLVTHSQTVELTRALQVQGRLNQTAYQDRTENAYM